MFVGFGSYSSPETALSLEESRAGNNNDVAERIEKQKTENGHVGSVLRGWKDRGTGWPVPRRKARRRQPYGSGASPECPPDRRRTGRALRGRRDSPRRNGGILPRSVPG